MAAIKVISDLKVTVTLAPTAITGFMADRLADWFALKAHGGKFKAGLTSLGVIGTKIPVQKGFNFLTATPWSFAKLSAFFTELKQLEIASMPTFF